VFGSLAFYFVAFTPRARKAEAVERCLSKRMKRRAQVEQEEIQVAHVQDGYFSIPFMNGRDSDPELQGKAL
jgi:hypothetical protein